MMDSQQQPPHPPWLDQKKPGREDAVLPFMLERNARELPDRVCFRFADGETWTWTETLCYTRRTAALLRGHGVGSGDFVLVWLPSGQAIIRAWFAINYLGAVFVPMNVDYKGKLLHHAITESNARVMIAHPQLIPRLNHIEPTQLDLLLSVGEPDTIPGLPLEVITTTLEGGDAEIGEPAPVDPWDVHMIIFTSGTTGPSKGVMRPYLHMHTVGQLNYGYMDSNDCILVDLSLFHVGGISPIISAITKQASIALFNGFKTNEFWQRTRDYDVTTTSGLIGSMASFLSKAPQKPDETNHDQEIFVAVVAKPGQRISERELAEYLVPRMAHYMVPRYIRVMDQLPRTATNKIMKVDIRNAGVTHDTWDREAENMKLKKTKFSN